LIRYEIDFDAPFGAPPSSQATAGDPTTSCVAYNVTETDFTIRCDSPFGTFVPPHELDIAAVGLAGASATPTLTPTATPTSTPTPLCVETPRGGCRSSEKSHLQLTYGKNSKMNKVAWKWIKGVATTQAEFGDPTMTTDYALCIYAGTAPSLIGQAIVPASSTKWSAAGTGYDYHDPAAQADGIEAITLRGSALNKSRATVYGKGASLPEVPLPVTAPVDIQLVNGGNGLCWSATYSNSDILKNDPRHLLAKAP
jgi:hypothetical protein